MRILITGGQGYIGSALFQHLHRRTHTVVTADVKRSGGEPQDYRSLPAGFIQDFDAIIHLAGHSSVALSDAAPVEALANNLQGVAEFIVKMKPEQRFIYASSGSVYSDGIGGADAMFRSMYDLSKYAVDGAVRILRPANSWGLRFGTVNGASPVMRWDLMVNGMVRSALETGVVRVSNPHVRRPILAMRDLCRAIDFLLTDAAPRAGVHRLWSVTDTVLGIAQQVAHFTAAKLESGLDGVAYDFEMRPEPWFTPIEDIEAIVRDVEKVAAAETARNMAGHVSSPMVAAQGGDPFGEYHR